MTSYVLFDFPLLTSYFLLLTSYFLGEDGKMQLEQMHYYQRMYGDAYIDL